MFVFRAGVWWRQGEEPPNDGRLEDNPPEPPSRFELDEFRTLGAKWVPDDGPFGLGFVRRDMEGISRRTRNNQGTEYNFTGLDHKPFRLIEADDGKYLSIEIVPEIKAERIGEAAHPQFRFRIGKVSYFDLDGDGMIEGFWHREKKQAWIVRDSQFLEVDYSPDIAETRTARVEKSEIVYDFRDGTWNEKRLPPE